jgi:hypothetical protein
VISLLPVHHITIDLRAIAGVDLTNALQAMDIQGKNACIP